MSEREPAAETARAFGLAHTDLDITGAQAEAAVERWLASMDQPSLDGLNVWLISRAVRAEGIVVALSGQGGDELFGGYPSFREVPRLRRAVRRAAAVPAPLRSMFARAAAAVARRPAPVRDKLADMFRTSGGLVDLALQRRRTMSDRQLAALGVRPGHAGLAAGFIPPAARALLSEDPADPVWTVSVAEALQYQGNTLLRDGDANGMAHGLEIRVPLLDQRLADLAFSVPGGVRLPDGAPGKHLLRAAFPDLLRPDLLTRPKRGFTLPIRRWMAGPLRDLCEAAVSAVKERSGLDARGVDAVWAQFVAAPESQTWSRAWTLVVLGDYLRRAGATIRS
jgi:asparagine synthase (glutamine-hydrolysing)